MLGGKLLAVGGQGCIFTPAHVRTSETKEVTKILKKDTAEKEFEISEYLRNFDPEGLYGNYATYIHKINPTDIKKEKFFADSAVCKIIDKENLYDNFLAITYPKYTVDADEMPIIMKKKNILFCIYTIWRSLDFLHESGVVHLDIRLKNLGYLNKRLIFSDWGHSCFVHCDTLSNKLKSLQLSAQIANNLPSWYPKDFMKVDPTSCEDLISYMFFIDIYGLAQSTIQLLKKYEIHDSGLLKTCKFFMQKKQYAKIAPKFICNYIIHKLNLSNGGRG